jgi:hypothetical protein
MPHPLQTRELHHPLRRKGCHPESRLWVRDLLQTRIPREPLFSQVIPVRIRTIDQSDLLLPPPPFNFLFTGNRHANILERLEMHQPMNTILGRKPWNAPFPMFADSFFQAAGNPDVDRSRSARQNVYKIPLRQVRTSKRNRVNHLKQIPRFARDDNVFRDFMSHYFPASIISTNCPNKYRASCGPGEASG